MQLHSGIPNSCNDESNTNSKKCSFDTSHADMHLISYNHKLCTISRVERTNRVSIPIAGLLLCTDSLQKRVSECAFDGYHWSNPKCCVNTDAWSQTAVQDRERKQLPWVPDSPIARKLKPQKFLKSEFWPISRKFVPAKITTVSLWLPFPELPVEAVLLQ